MNFIKKLFLWLLGILTLCAAGVFLFVKIAPQFGAPPEGASLARVLASPQYQDGVFVNGIPTSMDMSAGKMVTTLKEFMTAPHTTPDQPLPVDFNEGQKLSPDSLLHLTWFGHSAVLLEMEGKRILLDPMLGPAASPVPFFAQRFAYREPIDMAQFTDIDAVVFSHDHYDHLDYPSVQQLDPHVGHFYVPLGVGGTPGALGRGPRQNHRTRLVAVGLRRGHYVYGYARPALFGPGPHRPQQNPLGLVGGAGPQPLGLFQRRQRLRSALPRDR